MTQLTIPHDSNLLLLPMVYFLPEHMLQRCPTLRRLPRKVREVLQSETLMEIVASDQFLSEIMDASAALAFRHFGLPGWKEHYTGDSPAWKLSYSMHAWRKGLEDEIGWNLQALFYVPSNQSIPYFAPEEVTAIMGRVVRRVLEEQGWQGILDAVREMPCEEDFEKWNTTIQIDFQRKWYHSRSKRVQMVSLQECMKDEKHAIHKIADPSAEFVSDLMANDLFQQFKSTLSERDVGILKLRIQGLTYEKIAQKLGYKNHSGVQKRIRKICEAFTDYEDSDK